MKLKSKGLRPVGNSHAAQRDGVWVLQDFGDVVVHILREDQRAFYDLDSLWADAPRVTWKRATKKRSETKKAAAE